jgi:hypothetical protein
MILNFCQNRSSHFFHRGVLPIGPSRQAPEQAFCRKTEIRFDATVGQSFNIAQLQITECR